MFQTHKRMMINGWRYNWNIEHI